VRTAGTNKDKDRMNFKESPLVRLLNGTLDYSAALERDARHDEPAAVRLFS